MSIPKIRFVDIEQFLCAPNYNIILDAIAKRPKDAEQKIRMSRKTTKAYWRMVRRMTQTNGFYVSITGWFAIASSI